MNFRYEAKTRKFDGFWRIVEQGFPLKKRLQNKYKGTFFPEILIFGNFEQINLETELISDSHSLVLKRILKIN